jgi:hypothetical protein
MEENRQRNPDMSEKKLRDLSLQQFKYEISHKTLEPSGKALAQATEEYKKRLLLARDELDKKIEKHEHKRELLETGAIFTPEIAVEHSKKYQDFAPVAPVLG